MLDDKKIIKHRLLNGRKRLDGGKNTLHFHAEFRSNFKRPCNDRTFIKKIMSFCESHEFSSNIMFFDGKSRFSTKESTEESSIDVP